MRLMAESPPARLEALACLVQPDVAPSIGLATDRYLLGTLGKANRSRPGVLRIYSFPGDVLAAGRWHLAPSGAVDAGEAFVRRLGGGRALALGEGFLGISLLLPHRSALFAAEPNTLAPFQVLNRYVRGLLRALKSFGLAVFYPGRDLVTVSRRPIAAVSFETDEEGRLAFEAILAVERPLGSVARLLDRWDVRGTIKADLLALEAGTSLRAEIGESPTFGELAARLRDAFAEQYGVTVEEAPLSQLEQQAIASLAERESRAWTGARAARPDLRLTGASGIQTGVLEAHFSLEQERFIKDMQLAGDFIANSPAIAALEYRLRLCPADWSAIARVVDQVFSHPSNYLLGIGRLRTVADTIVKGLPA
jgi:lipoate-protein ligase A